MTIDYATLDTLETENGTVDLVGLSNEERLVCAMLEHVDPATYYGPMPFECLIGQTGIGLGYEFGNEGNVVDFVAKKFDINRDVIGDIFWSADDEEYHTDFSAAMDMAREKLGVTRF